MEVLGLSMKFKNMSYIEKINHVPYSALVCSESSFVQCNKSCFYLLFLEASGA